MTTTEAQLPAPFSDKQETVLPPSAEAQQLLDTLGQAARGEGTTPPHKHFNAPFQEPETGLPVYSSTRLVERPVPGTGNNVITDASTYGDPSRPAGTSLTSETSTPGGKVIESQVSYGFDRSKYPIEGRFTRTKGVKQDFFSPAEIRTTEMSPRQIKAAEKLARLKFGLNGNPGVQVGPMTTEEATDTPEEVAQPPENSGETLGHEGFTLKVDKQKIADSTAIPEGMKEWMSRLPENLTFSEPVTLIVGENGSGKTQFARGVVNALAANRVGSDGRNNAFLLEKDEPARDVAGALASPQPRHGNQWSAFIEGPEIMAGTRVWAKDQARMRTQGQDIDAYTPGSTREMFEESIRTVKKLRVDDHRSRVFGAIQDRDDLPERGGEVIVVFDEPEQGLSPQRQMDLPEQVAAMFDKSDTLLIPTNNLALYLSDLPRLDLSQPERGVFRPSEYNESGKIEFHAAKP